MERERARPVSAPAWSSHGEAKRNSGHFTRGSQLRGHQLSMWRRGAQVPFLFWTAVFLLLFCATLVHSLHDYEFQMIEMKGLAAAWGYIGFSPTKPVNVTLIDGSIRPTIMSSVPYIYDVQVAWGRLITAFLGSFFFASVAAVPFTFWFIKWAKKRSHDMLAEHHERGAELTTRDALISILEANNVGELASIAAQEFPGISFADVMKFSPDIRRQKGLVEAYRIATLPYPYGREQNHTVVFGTTGTGKTTALRSIIAEAAERFDSCVIFDLAGHYVEAFYDPSRDHILNLNDERCESWSVFNDCDTQSEFVSAAAALIPDKDGAEGGFWERAARSLFVEMCVKLKAEGKGTNSALSRALLTATLKEIYAKLKGTVADPITSPDAARMANSVRGVFNSHAEALRFLPENGPAFSIREWIKKEDKGASILFVTSRHVDMAMNRPLVSLWMNTAIHTLMTLPHTRRLRTWFIFDELGALHQLPSIKDGMQTSRSFGGAFVLGIHSLAALREVYGDNGSRNLISLTYTKLILGTGDRDTAEECSKLIGHREVRTMDEAYSYGAHTERDTSTISPTRNEKPLVFPDDITSLKNLHGYIRFREGYPAAYLTMPYVTYRKIAEAFIVAPQLPRLSSPLADDDEDDTEETSGRDGAANIIDASEREVRARPKIAREGSGTLLGDDRLSDGKEVEAARVTNDNQAQISIDLVQAEPLAGSARAMFDDAATIGFAGGSDAADKSADVANSSILSSDGIVPRALGEVQNQGSGDLACRAIATDFADLSDNTHRTGRNIATETGQEHGSDDAAPDIG
jgi:type IV conjugative transfer system coupling protein TraD